MTYNTNLQVTQQEATPELYEFTYGGVVERYTSWPETLNFGGYDYEPAPIKRSGISIDSEFSKVKVSIIAPVIDAFSRHVANTPIESTRVRIYSALKSDLTDYVLIFKGSVAHVSIKDYVAKAECVSTSDILENYYPSVTFQSYCNHMLFDSGCKLDNSVYKVQGAVVSISGADYEVSGLNAYSDGYFTAGTVEYGSDVRMILKHVGNIITLHVPFDSRVAINTVVDVYPGCDGAPDTCKNKFNNYDNFLGFPLIPSTNPVMWGLK